MESKEQRYEVWMRRHEERFSNLTPGPGLGAKTIRVIQALAKTIGRLAFVLQEEDADRRFRSYERAMDELADTLNEIAGGAND